jgi:hypothetical protein
LSGEMKNNVGNSRTGKIMSLIQSFLFTSFSLKSELVKFFALLRIMKQYKKKTNNGIIFHKPGKKSNRYKIGNPMKNTSSSDAYISFLEIIF